MQGRQARGIGATQLESEKVGEQMVVAKPRAPDIERAHERVCLLELLQDPLRTLTVG